MNAYDYDKQRWETGEAGTRLRIAQLRDELTVLKGPDGERYVRDFVDCRGLLPSYVRSKAVETCEHDIEYALLTLRREREAAMFEVTEGA